VTAIADYVRLSREEEISAWQRGDLDSLAKSVLPYCRKLAAKVCSQYSFSDVQSAESEAYWAMLVSLRTFDASKARLTTYVTMPVSRRVFNFVMKQIKRGERLSAGSVNQRSDKSDSSIADSMADEKQIEALVRLELEEDSRVLHDAISLLDERERLIVFGRMDGASFLELGEQIGKSKQRVKQIYDSALGKIRVHFRQVNERRTSRRGSGRHDSPARQRRD
jgi:RNA polymerase sigma factor (sigma-70 family)